MTGWIPAFAESTPRIEKKYSGGTTEPGGSSQSTYGNSSSDLYHCSKVGRIQGGLEERIRGFGCCPGENAGLVASGSAIGS